MSNENLYHEQKRQDMNIDKLGFLFALGSPPRKSMG